MPITIQHELSPATTGVLAHEAGRQARQERDLDRRRKDLEFAAQQQLRWEQLGMQAADQEKDRQARVAMALQEMGQREALAGRELQQRRDLNEADWQNRFKIQEMADDARQQAQIQEGLRKGFFRYTPAQERRINQLNDSLGKIRSDPKFSPEQKAFAAQKINDELRDLMRNPVPVPVNQREVPLRDQIAAKVVDGGEFNPAWAGEPMALDRNGVPMFLKRQPDPAAEDQQAGQKADELRAKQQEKLQAQQQRLQEAVIDTWEAKNDWAGKRADSLLNDPGWSVQNADNNPVAMRQKAERQAKAEADQRFGLRERFLNQQLQQLQQQGQAQAAAGQGRGAVPPEQLQMARFRLSQLRQDSQTRQLDAEEQAEARQLLEVLRAAVGQAA